jgi:hypothetical protein
MKLRDKFVKVFAFFVLGSATIGLGLTALDNSVIHPEIEKQTWSCLPNQSYQAPSVISASFPLTGTKSEFLARLFQLMFILFFISPPIIAVMLFLIWKELKEKNKMK